MATSKNRQSQMSCKNDHKHKMYVYSMYVNVANRTAVAISYVVKRITIFINVRF